MIRSASTRCALASGFLLAAGCAPQDNDAPSQFAQQRASEIAAATSAPAVVNEIVWEPTSDVAPHDLDFESMRMLIQAGEVALSGGEPIEDPDLWAAVLTARTAHGFCTAAVIGPRVLLTAAHCVDAKVAKNPKTVTGTVSFHAGSPVPLLSCEMHPDYASANLLDKSQPRTSEDFALCEMNGEAPEMILETLGSAMQEGDPILLAGYGCINVRVYANKLTFDSGKIDGKDILRIGEATLDAVGVLNSGENPGEYLRTRSADFEPTLCPGDSGGPAFSGATLANQNGRRRIVGVNSKVVAVPFAGTYEYLSFMSAIGSPAFESFRKAWTDKNTKTRKVCGRDIVAGSRNCRA